MLQTRNNTITEEIKVAEKNEINEKQEDNKETSEMNGNSSDTSLKEKKNNTVIKSTGISLNYTHTGVFKSKQYIMKKAKLKSKKIVAIKKGKKVTILGEKSIFYKIKYKKGKKIYTGFIKKKYVEMNVNLTIIKGKVKRITPKISPKNSTDKIKENRNSNNNGNN